MSAPPTSCDLPTPVPGDPLPPTPPWLIQIPADPVCVSLQSRGLGWVMAPTIVECIQIDKSHGVLSEIEVASASSMEGVDRMPLPLWTLQAEWFAGCCPA